MPTPSWEIRCDEDDVFDEVVASNPASVHLERMDNCAWWLGITFDDGTEIHVNIGARNQHAKSYATYWVEDGDPEGPLSNARMPAPALNHPPGGNDTDVISEAVRKAHSE